MGDFVIDFYDRLSLEYRHNMGWDWEAGMRWQGETLDRLLGDQLGRRGPCSVLDCSCGIGTQAIGLALQGHRVYATDLSPVSIDCAHRESAKFGVEIEFGVADFRTLGEAVSDTFDVVISCDNAVAHCLEDDDLTAALVSMKERLKPGGLLLFSLRDYDALVAEKPRFTNDHIHDRPDGRRVAFQVWDWATDGNRYHLTQFLIKETDGDYALKHFEAELRAWLREEVMAAVQGAGYDDVRWHIPEATDYYQPIVTARNQ